MGLEDKVITAALTGVAWEVIGIGQGQWLLVATDSAFK